MSTTVVSYSTEDPIQAADYKSVEPGLIETITMEKDNVAENQNTYGGRVKNSVTDHQPSYNGIHPLYPRSSFKLEDYYIDQPRSFRVVVIGAGIAGITAGMLLPQKVPGLDLRIYEKNEDVGGVWLENRYPGVRCDVPSHVYQSTFSPNTQWTEVYARGPEIHEYWKSQARKHGVNKYISFRHRILDMRWDAAASKWILSICNENGETFIDKADFVITATGRFNAYKLPSYEGMEYYQGVLRHTSNWDEAFDPMGKTVAVIGNGASGIQVVPTLQRVAKQIDHYVRSKTWIAGSDSSEERTLEPQYIPPDQRDAFEKNPAEYLKFRKQLEGKAWTGFTDFLRGSKSNAQEREQFIETMRKRLVKKPELLESLVPEFSPNCRRLTPGPGYLEALTEPNVRLIQTPIKRFTKTGIETIDGQHRQVDAIFCATGANVDSAPTFSIRAGDVDLKTAWTADGQFGFPYTYLGLATPGFPNLFFAMGPHGSGPAGNIIHSLEVQLTYYAKVLRKVSQQGIKSIVPSKKATDDFISYSDAYFAKTVLSDNCSSWFNGGRPGGRIHGIWPGSAAHLTTARRDPRWEDWEYEHLSASGNVFAYFGNGMTAKELDPEADMTAYLQAPGPVDVREVHERWWSTP